jgi:hypothetical protein
MRHSISLSQIRHLPDWIYPDDSSKAQALFDSHVEFRVARHIADRGKHFHLTRPWHKQVVGRSASYEMAFQDRAFQADAFQVGGLIVELNPQDPETLVLGRRPSALALAQKVFAVAEQVVV